MNGKKFISLVSLALSVVLCLSSCMVGGSQKGNALGAKSTDVKRFASLLIDNEYANAVELYNAKIAGNTELEAEAATCIETYLSQIEAQVLSGECDQASAKAKCATVEKIYSQTGCTVDNYGELTESVDRALASKVAYKSGISLMEAGNYADAVAELSKVLPEDSDYADACEKLETASENYVQDVIKRADESIAEDNYMKAASLLKDAIRIIPDDATLLAKLNTCEKNYIAKVISDADAVFTDYTKYEDALRIIQAGMQNYPDNDELSLKYEYYLEYTPVSVFDLNTFTVERGGLDVYDNITDNMQNTYEKAYYHRSNKSSNTYDIMKEYNIFRATVAIPNISQGSESNASIIIYGDGKVLWKKTDISGSLKPFDIDVDVTGVTDLKIEMETESIFFYVLLADVTLQKTAK